MLSRNHFDIDIFQKGFKIVAATPGLLAIPAPTTETFPTVSSVLTPSAPICSAVAVVISVPVANCSVGKVNEMSVTPS